MPKSKRNKVVPLTKTKAKDREHKTELIEKMREAVESYPSVYTFKVENLRTNIMQDVRNDRRGDSRIFMGNNKVMMIALGKDDESSPKPNLHKLSRFLAGQCGVLFTSLPKRQVKEYFANVGGSVFARAGQPAATSFSIPAGPLQFPHSMFEHLQKLGLSIRLEKGVIVLTNDTVVCEAGEPLSTEAAQILKLFGLVTADFKLTLTGHWENDVARKIGA